MVLPLAMLGLSVASSVIDGLTGATNAASGASASKAAQAKSGTRKTADDFESMFLEQSMDRLTQNLGAEGPLGDNGEGGAIYKSMLSKEYAQSIVKSGGIGIGDQVYSQMLKLQEGAGNAGSP